MRTSNLSVNEVNQYFTKLVGLISWGAHRSIGSTITLHLGDKVKYQRSDGSIGYLGSWSIMIELADWSIIEKSSDKEIITSDMVGNTIDNLITESLKGKRFKSVSINIETLNTKFEIGDLIISVTPYQNKVGNSDGDIWSLYTPFEKCISLNNYGEIQKTWLSAL